MGQPVAVTEKPSSKPGIVRFETNRSFTGMGHEHFAALREITGHRPTDELARRLLATGKVDGVHVYMNMITVDVKKGYEPTGLKEVIEGLYTYWQPGMVPPSFDDVAAEEPAVATPSASGAVPADDAMSEAAKKVPAALLERSRLARERAKAKAAAGE
ncbi:MAG TPA: hypothetical protein VK461_04170 [Acidimicrobiales bacterium]|nr:hypothetical protein [Acidimicrobiales bacterium]